MVVALAERRGQLLHRGVGVERRQRQRDAIGLRQPLEHADGQQGMAAEIEEIVGDADPTNAEQVFPELDELALDGVAGLDDLVGRRRGQGLGRRQPLAIDLSARRERQGRQRDEERRDHVRRQSLSEEWPQLGQRRAARRAGDDVRHEALAAVPVGSRRHGHLPDLRMLGDRRFHLTRLDPEAADLHLVVEPAEILERPVEPPAHEITGPVDPRARLAGERIGDELLPGQVGPIDVAERDARAAEEQLARHADGRELAMTVHHVGVGVGNRPSDRH